MPVTRGADNAGGVDSATLGLTLPSCACTLCMLAAGPSLGAPPRRSKLTQLAKSGLTGGDAVQGEAAVDCTPEPTGDVGADLGDTGGLATAPLTLPPRMNRAHTRYPPAAAHVTSTSDTLRATARDPSIPPAPRRVFCVRSPPAKATGDAVGDGDGLAVTIAELAAGAGVGVGVPPELGDADCGSGDEDGDADGGPGDGDGVAVTGGGEYTAGSSESPTDTWYTRVGRRMIAAEPSK